MNIRLFGKLAGNKRAQSVMEMGVLLLVIAAAMIAMQTYLKRGIQGRLREGVDNIGDQYDPGATTSDFTLTHVSNITTNSATQEQSIWLGQYWDGWAWVDIYQNVTLATSTQQTHYDNTLKTGWETVANP